MLNDASTRDNFQRFSMKKIAEIIKPCVILKENNTKFAWKNKNIIIISCFKPTKNVYVLYLKHGVWQKWQFCFLQNSGLLFLIVPRGKGAWKHSELEMRPKETTKPSTTYVRLEERSSVHHQTNGVISLAKYSEDFEI